MVSQKSNKNEIIIKCPYCGDKNDNYHIKTGHFHMYINVDTGRYHCFLCGKKGHDIKQFIQENRNKFDNNDIIRLSKEYLFQIKKKEIFYINRENIEKNNKIKQYIDYLYNNFLCRSGMDYLYKRIYIEENDNKQFANYLVQNKIIFPICTYNKNINICNDIKESYKNVLYYSNFVFIIPMLFNNGFQLHTVDKHTYITYSNKDKLLPNYILLHGKSNNLYIVEGIFDGLKLYNITNKQDNVLITLGKTNVSHIVEALKYTKLNYQYLNYIFAFDNDIKYNEYLRLIKQFKNGYNINNIQVIIFKNKDIKDIGEIQSIQQYKNDTQIIDYNVYSIKKIYENIIKQNLIEI